MTHLGSSQPERIAAFDAAPGQQILAAAECRNLEFARRTRD